MDRTYRKGMKFGLWFAPDSANDFENWLKDADCILGYYQTLGVQYFKIDGVIAVTRKGERNLRRFFDHVLEESDGEIVFDLDVTANIRPGYFGMVNVGPIFVENRYTDWFNYWPHRTLRNFWQLARWIDPVRLRMEFLNNARNTALYQGDPLAPGAYSPACLLATVLFSSPLGWFETTGLDEPFVSEVAELIEIRRTHCDAWFSGTILPIGSVPDGMVWTGFLSLGVDGASAYALVFRELAPSPEWTLSLDGISDREVDAVEILAGDGTAVFAKRAIRFRIPQKLGFLLIRVKMAQQPSVAE